jgi:hypothetical protein
MQCQLKIEGPNVSIDITPNRSSDYVSNSISEDSSNMSYNYSGHHDHGPLAQLREGGYYSTLIASLQEMKTECDSSIQIQQELHTNKTVSHSELSEKNDSCVKKPRLG